MGLIRKSRKHNSKKPRLALKVHVVQVRNVGLFKEFKCNPFCLVVTNSVYGNKTSRLRNNRSKWDEVVKLKLPLHPRNEWLRIIVYDPLQRSPPNESSDYQSTGCTSDVNSMAQSNSSASSTSVNNTQYRSENSISSYSNNKSTSTVSVSSSKKKPRSSNSYLYVGEAKVSLLELFKKKDTATSYKFSVEPKWYKLYDKRLQRFHRDKSEASYVIGEIQLGFFLTSNSRKISTIQAYNNWRNSLVAVLEHKKNMKKCRTPPCLTTASQSSVELHESGSKSEKRANKTFDEVGKTDFSSFEHLNSDDGFDNDGTDDIDTEYDLISEVGTLASEIVDAEELELVQGVSKNLEPNYSNLPFISDYYDEDDDDNDDGVEDDDEVDDDDDVDDDDVVSAILEGEGGGFEYDGMDPSVIESLSRISLLNNFDEGIESGPIEMLEEDGLLDTEDEDDETGRFYDEFGNRLRMRNSGSKLRHLRKRDRNKHLPLNQLLHMPNYKVVKKSHALGVVFVEFKEIKHLPPLRNRVSRRHYDMDPFVVATFGRRVFKTSWRKHTLNPIFNECAAFEVFPEESHFTFHFNVMDKDSFSYNDKIAHGELPWSEVLTKHHEDDDWALYELPLQLEVQTKDDHKPVLYLRIKYFPYSTLKKFFWQKAVFLSTNRDSFDIVDLTLYLDKIGSFTVNEICDIFRYFNKVPWGNETINRQQLIEYLQMGKTSTGFWNVWKCPKCFRSCKPTRNTRNSKLVPENDLITHFSVCSYQGDCKLLKPSYVSSDFASKRWFTKFLIKLTYGKYALGSNNANILVQDRETGIVLEEKISAHVKLGMRIIYNGKGIESRRFRSLLKSLSVRQGKKFDDPLSVRQIEPFIKFHSLNIDDCQQAEYKNFNEFFFRKLKKGSRIPEGNSNIFVSPADSRCTVFSSIHQSKEIWIKGTKFTLARLTKGYKPEVFNDRSCNIAIFRLAPQDYHRFHSPCNAVVGKPIYIDGEYYTVNPMAIRSSLDVFGENIRVVIPLESPEFGTVLCIAIGAMMVGSIILTCKEGDILNRGDEVGYFKFGGSTIVVVAPSKNINFDADLLKNSIDGIETLVKVGMSVGHTSCVPEYVRERKSIANQEEVERIKRAISVSDDNIEILGSPNWEFHTLKKLLTSDYSEPSSSTNNYESKINSSNSSSSPSTNT